MSFRMGLGPLAAALALIAMPHSVAAQTKVAVVDLQQALLGTAETKKADSAMSAKFTPRQIEMERVNGELTKLQQTLQAGGDAMTPQAVADNQAQTARRQRELQRMQEDYQADIEKDRNEVLAGITQKMVGIVKQVADEKGIDLVVDRANTLYFKDPLDLTKDVIAAYDKANPVAAAKPAAK
jgi:outer membrane protein